MEEHAGDGDRPHTRAHLGDCSQLGVLTRTRRCRRDGPVLGASAASVRGVAPREPALAGGFATESAGWLVYIAALRLAPISLVQAVSASGIAVLALVMVHGHPGRLARNEQIAVVVAVTGLVLLSLSVVGTNQQDQAPEWAAVAIWLGGSVAAALILAGLRLPLARGPALGLAAGLLFAGGDISAKLVVYGGLWFFAILSLIVCYGLGTSVLQAGFQHSNALTAAGLATLATNAVPIAAGFVLFGEELPGGAKGALQVAAFASLVVSAVLLGHPARRR